MALYRGIGRGIPEFFQGKRPPPFQGCRMFLQLFLQELLTTTRNFPTALFDDEQGRMKVLDAVQEAVDKAVEREDEYLAQQEG